MPCSAWHDVALRITCRAKHANDVHRDALVQEIPMVLCSLIRFLCCTQVVASEDEEDAEEEPVQNDRYAGHAASYGQQAYGDAYGQAYRQQPALYQEQDYEMAQRAALGLRGRPAKVRCKRRSGPVVHTCAPAHASRHCWDAIPGLITAPYLSSSIPPSALRKVLPGGIIPCQPMLRGRAFTSGVCAGGPLPLRSRGACASSRARA